MTLLIRTAHYRYSGPDRLDITVKGEHPFGKFLAPNWDMVMAVKKHGKEAHPFYLKEYWKILDNVPNWVWEALLKEEAVTFVCFCRQEEFCHRNILIEYMRDYRKFPVYYEGWVS